MQRRTPNDDILSKYFKDHSVEGAEIPYMTIIAKETGVSVATISRFAKRRGFYNFAEMRAHFNLALGDEGVIFDDHGLIKFLKDGLAYKGDVYIIPSMATKTLGYHMRERLNEMHIPADMRRYKANKTDELGNIQPDDKIVLISLSGRSAWYESFVDAKIKNKAVLISTEKPKKTLPNITNIILDDFKLDRINKIEKNKAVRKVLEWLDDVLTQIQIEFKNEGKSGK